jgi:hypothetical protein
MLDAAEQETYDTFQALGWMHVRDGVPWAPTADSWNGFAQLAYETGRLRAANVRVIEPDLPVWQPGTPMPRNVLTLYVKSVMLTGDGCIMKRLRMQETGRFENL